MRPLRGAWRAVTSALAAVVLLGLAAPGAHAQDILHYADQFFTTEVGPNKVPHSGTVQLVAVPLTFGSDPGYAAFNTFFDPDPDAGYTFSNYWRVQSGGRYDPRVTVVDAVPSVCPVSSGDGCSIDLQDADLLVQLFTEVFETVMADNPGLFASLDLSGPAGAPDGWTDGVITLVPGWWGGVAPPVWPFAEFIQDGVQLGNLGISYLDREVVLHEFGHNLGACDQYLWNHRFTLMGNCFDCSLDVHSRVALGWSEVIEVGEGEELVVELHPGPGEPVVRVGSPPEYFLVERRAPYLVGDRLFDAGVDGIVVVHVDERVSPPVLAQTDYPINHPLMKVETATGTHSDRQLGPGQGLYPAPDHAPTDDTTSFDDTNWYDGTRSGIRIADIEELADRGGASGKPAYRVRITGPGGPAHPGPDDDPGSDRAADPRGGDGGGDGATDGADPPAEGTTGSEWEQDDGQSGCSAPPGRPGRWPWLVFGVVVTLAVRRRTASWGASVL